jgi:hypothetical protein
MSENNGKFVQPERGPLGKLYEILRIRVNRYIISRFQSE